MTRRHRQQIALPREPGVGPAAALHRDAARYAVCGARFQIVQYAVATPLLPRLTVEEGAGQDHPVRASLREQDRLHGREIGAFRSCQGQSEGVLAGNARKVHAVAVQKHVPRLQRLQEILMQGILRFQPLAAQRFGFRLQRLPHLPDLRRALRGVQIGHRLALDSIRRLCYAILINSRC